MRGRLVLLVLLSAVALGLDLGAALAARDSLICIPASPRAPAKAFDGRLRLVDWNVHRFRGPNHRGAPPQQDPILDELGFRPADLYLLQEIPPDEAQDTVNALGWAGYQSVTLHDKSNLLAIRSDFKVVENRRLWLFPGPHPASGTDALAVFERYRHYSSTEMDRQYFEPRTAQLLTLELPTGARVVVFNSHLTSGPADYQLAGQPSLSQVRLEQARLLCDALEATGLPVVGGGDLNGPEVAEEFRRRGYAVAGRELDYLVSKPWPLLEVEVDDDLRDPRSDEVRLSDHPLLTGVVTLP